MNEVSDVELSFLNFSKAFDVDNDRILCTKLAVREALIFW